MIVVHAVALLAVVPRQALGRAVALSGLRVALLGLAVALARLALAAVDGAAPVAGHAPLAVRSRREIAAGYASAVRAAGVAVALAGRALREVPAVGRTGARWQGFNV